MGMTDFPNITEPVKPLYESSISKKEELDNRRRNKQSKTKAIKEKSSGKSIKRRSSNSVVPFDGVIVPTLKQSCTQEILIRSGYKWCSYLHRPKMEDGFEEVRFQDDVSQHKSNFHNNLEVNLKSGDTSNTVAAYLDHSQKSHDYIDDVLSFQPQLNNFQSIKGNTHKNDDHITTNTTQFISTTTSSATTTTQTTTVTNNSNSSPLKPPRHVKLKKTLHNNNKNSLNSYHVQQTNNIDNNIISAITNADVIHKSVYLDPSNNSEPSADTNRNYRNKYISIGVQASPLPPYRLRVLPKCPSSLPAKKLDESTIGDEVMTSSGCLLCLGIQSCGHCVGRVFMSQCGLGFALFAWALLGAAAFHFTEGPSELQEAQRLKTLQNDLVVGLATDLRLIDNLQPAWRETIEKYIDKHEVLLLEGVSSGYGEGGGKNGQIWSYPGCILFAISLLTTLGFGAPVPRTTMGRTTAVVFSAIGIPLHFLLILNIGMVLARRLQRLSNAYPTYTLDNLNEKKCHSFDFNIAIPKWLTWFPVVAGITYYILGTLIFGVARGRQFESFLFPLDFTATGGVGLTPGYMRISYGLYLEGAVILAGIAVSLLQNSATSKLTEIGLKLGLLTNS